MLRFFAVAALIGASLFGVACSDDDDPGANDATTGAVATDTADERDSFIDDIEGQIEAWRADLEEIRQDIASGDPRDEAEQQLDALQGRIDEAETKLGDARDASDDEWETLKDEFGDLVNSAEDLLNELRTELGLD